MYDEETGKPIVSKKTGERLRRINEARTLPCIFDICAKGHFSEELPYNPRYRMAIELYHAVQASHGAILNEAERNDPITAKVLGEIDKVYKVANIRRQTEQLAQLIAITRQQG